MSLDLKRENEMKEIQSFTRVVREQAKEMRSSAYYAIISRGEQNRNVLVTPTWTAVACMPIVSLPISLGSPTSHFR